MQRMVAREQKIAGKLINAILYFINFCISLYTVAISADLYMYHIKMKIHKIRFKMLHATCNGDFVDR